MKHIIITQWMWLSTGIVHIAVALSAQPPDMFMQELNSKILLLYIAMNHFTPAVHWSAKMIYSRKEVLCTSVVLTICMAMYCSYAATPKGTAEANDELLGLTNVPSTLFIAYSHLCLFWTYFPSSYSGSLPHRWNLGWCISESERFKCQCWFPW